MKKSTRQFILAIAICLLCLLLGFGVWLSKHTKKQETTAVEPTPTLTAAAPITSLSASNNLLTSCAKPGTEIIPTRFSIPQRGISEPVITVGREADGAVGSPPKDQRFTVAFWDESPKPGSTKGHVITTVHTWNGDIALGNVLADKEKGLQSGDIIQLSDGKTTVCYRYTDKQKISVATYDSSSNIWLNPEGPAKLTIMICWDYNSAIQDWDSRYIFFGDLVG
ncbi:MAG: class F sortase [Propionibacteriaceae bacterium]